MSVGIGLVTSHHAVGECVVAATAVLGLIVAVAAVELFHLADGLMEQQVLVAVDGFVPLAVGDRPDDAASPDGKGTAVEVGTLRGLAAIHREVDGTVFEY